MSYHLLSASIRKFIRDKGWEELRPIQHAAIDRIMRSEENFILASRTASGKTEAAFLPILSKVNFNIAGVRVLYISPLIALINDQFYRIEELCKHLDVTVTKWHGEANKTLKERLINHPNGIVLITSESLEAMFIHKPFYVRQLFSALKYVVIDEIHSFIGTDRGVQLKSILSRLQRINTDLFSVIGLSATIGDYHEAKRFTGNESNTKVLLDRSAREINTVFRYFKNENEELPWELLNDLYIESKDHKVLIFPNSRGRSEEVAVKLRKIATSVKGHLNYFSHHSSVDRDLREYIEDFAKTNQRHNFCISCTSTLELGIDIGSVDKVVQIDATYNIASLIQRVGRSGRKEGQSSNVLLYATNQWTLLQALSCWILYKEGFIEPPGKNEYPYDILAHQALSITKGHSGILLTELIKHLKENSAFNLIGQQEIEEILHHLIDIDFLEKLQHEVIIGIEGEKVVNSREFYSVFKTEENFSVVNAGNSIGEIPFSPQIRENENILLAAGVWKIICINHKSKRIDVIPAMDGKKPLFYGEAAVVHQKVREKMFEIIYSRTDYDFLDPQAVDEIDNMRKDFAVFKIRNLPTERPLLIASKHLRLFTFAGTRVNRTIQLLLNIAEIKNTLDESSSSFYLEVPVQELMAKWDKLSLPLINIDTHISTLLDTNPALLAFSKWGRFLPRNYQIKLVKNNYFDIEQTKEFLSNIKLIANKQTAEWKLLVL